MMKVSHHNLRRFRLGCYSKFIYHHPILASKPVVKFGSKRNKWITFDKVSFMYDTYYDVCYDTDIAIRLNETVNVGKQENEVRDDSPKILGR